MEQTTNAGAEAPKRPTFITVLCILTWIGCGISIITSVLLVSGAAMLQAGASALGGETGSVMTNVYIQLAAGILGALMCLFGSIQMWKLKKAGFYMYAIGQVIAIAVPFIFPIVGMTVSGAGYAMSMGGPILFIVLYGLNLKHMK